MTEAPARDRVRFRSVFAQLVDQLGADIVADRFTDPTLPIEGELASHYGVSRNLLREATKVLASKNLLAVRPKSGTRIRPDAEWHLFDHDVLDWIGRAGHGLDHALDLVEIRLIVEPRASFLAALRATAAERDAIAHAYQAYANCGGESHRITELDGVFHRAVLEASHNALLRSIGLLLGAATAAQVRVTTDQPGAYERGLPLHRELADAIGAGDAPWAEDAASRLVRMPYDDIADRVRLPPARRLATAPDAGHAASRNPPIRVGDARADNLVRKPRRHLA